MEIITFAGQFFLVDPVSNEEIDGPYASYDAAERAKSDLLSPLNWGVYAEEIEEIEKNL